MQTQQQSSPIGFAIALAIIILLLGMVRAALPQTIAAPPMPVRAAITRAVEDRLGPGSIATIRSLQTGVPEDEQVTAVPEPASVPPTLTSAGSEPLARKLPFTSTVPV